MKEKVCAVTGVGRGIGHQIATDLAKSGAKVYCCDIDESMVRDIEKQAKRNNLKLLPSVCDVSNEKSVIQFFFFFKRQKGGWTY